MLYSVLSQCYKACQFKKFEKKGESSPPGMMNEIQMLLVQRHFHFVFCQSQVLNEAFNDLAADITAYRE